MTPPPPAATWRRRKRDRSAGWPRGVACWLEEDTERAATIFRTLADNARVGEQARVNLEQVEE